MTNAMANNRNSRNNRKAATPNEGSACPPSRIARWRLGIIVAAIAGICGCRQLPPPETAPVAGRPEAGQSVFAGDEEAAKALIRAATDADTNEVARVFGPAARRDLLSGDAVQDRRGLEQFAKRAGEGWRLEKQEDRKTILYVGKRDCPFPIPIIRAANEKWFFDAAAGKAEILARRIGRNELEAIKMSRAFLQYQREYASQIRDDSGVLKYAQRYFSAPGKRDGLYWETKPDEEKSPAAPLVEAAERKGYSMDKSAADSCVYMGYVYRILSKQGPAAAGGRYDYVVNGNMIAGFALVACPVKHASSGIMTFIVNHQGKLYEKNLGPKTREIAEKMAEYNPDDTWSPVED